MNYRAPDVLRSTALRWLPTALAACLATSALTAADSPTADDQPLRLDQLVVTGSVTPQTKLESALAVTTLDPTQVQAYAPRSTAAMLKLIPGIYIESSGGEAGNNLVARGVATNGSVGGYLYVALQEDGLPVISESNFRFTQADAFVRITNFVDRIEALRGGSAGVFQSSDPLGIINFISREGTAKFQGEWKMETGDYGLLRNEAWISGPAGNNATFAIGGFYRIDDGIRPPGYTADRGGQLMGNIKWQLPDNKGYVKVSAKAMNDHPAFELPFPLQNALPVALGGVVSPGTIPGGPDLRTGAVTSTDIRRLSFPTTPMGPLNIDLANGEGVDFGYVGTDVEYRLTDGLKFKSLDRYTSGTHVEVRNPFSTADTLQNIANGLAKKANSAGNFAAALNPATGNYNFAVSAPGQGGATLAANPAAAATLNGNGLGDFISMTNIKIDLKNFQQDTRLTQSLNDGNTTVTAGLYYSYFQVATLENVDQELIDISKGLHRLDVTFLDATSNAPLGKYTYNGITQLGTTYINSYAEKREVDWFAALTQKFGPLSLDIGYRYLKADLSGWAEAPATYDGNNFIASTTGGAVTLSNGALNYYPALRNAVFGGGNTNSGSDSKGDHAFTAGANYVFGDKHTAVFARFSRSPKMIYTNDVLAEIPYGPGSGNATPTPFAKQNLMTQYELGLKYSRSSLGLFLTAFKVQERNIVFADTVFLPNGSLGTGPLSTLDEDVTGVEIEGVWTPRFVPGLALSVHGTVQDPKFVNNVHIKGYDGSGNVIQLAVNGLQPVRIPKVYGNVSASYTLPLTPWGTLAADASVQYTSKRPVDQANSEYLAHYYEVGAGASFTMPFGLTLRVAVSNLLNSAGITEGDPRSNNNVVANLAAPYANYRPVLPRTVVASATYRF